MQLSGIVAVYATAWCWALLVGVPVRVAASQLRSSTDAAVVTSTITTPKIPSHFVEAATQAGYTLLNPVSVQGRNSKTFFATRLATGESVVVKFAVDFESGRNTYAFEIKNVDRLVKDDRTRDCLPKILHKDIEVPYDSYKGYVMERGTPLPRLHDDFDGADQQRAAIMRRLLECVAAMHNLGLAHRDIKPQGSDNVVMVRGRPVFIDFGMMDDLGNDGRSLDYKELVEVFRDALCPREQNETSKTSACWNFCDRLNQMWKSTNWSGLKRVTDPERGDPYLRIAT
jgi:tRNA A-37 threonylcarbamoyl transferase component Bud32